MAWVFSASDQRNQVDPRWETRIIRDCGDARSNPYQNGCPLENTKISRNNILLLFVWFGGMYNSALGIVSSLYKNLTFHWQSLEGDILVGYHVSELGLYTTQRQFKLYFGARSCGKSVIRSLRIFTDVVLILTHRPTNHTHSGTGNIPIYRYWNCSVKM